MKKWTIALCICALLASLSGCAGPASEATTSTAATQTTAASSERNPIPENVIMGQVSAIDGTMLTLNLGEMGGRGGFGGMGQMPQNGELPEGMEKPADGEMPEMPEGMEKTENGRGNRGGMNGNKMPEGMEKPADGEMPELPEGMEMPEGMGDRGGRGGFTATGETKTIDIAGAQVTTGFGENAAEGKVEDIAVDDIVMITLDDDGKAETVMVMNMGGFGGQMGMPGGFGGGAMEVEQGTAATTIDKDEKIKGENYTSGSDDENALRVTGATVELENITVNKDGGATSNTETGDFYGMNAALLATDGAKVTIKNATVNSAAQNGNGVFSYGQGTVVDIFDSTITTEADNSGGIQTTGGGTTNGSNLVITTSGNSSAAIRSDRGGGTVKVDKGVYVTNGVNSPAVYSTANITVSNATLSANKSEALVIEGKNSIVLENCQVTGNMSDTEGSSSSINVHNVMIYQSMSGDADVGTSSFSMTGGKLTSNYGDMFYVTNTHAVMKLSGVVLDHKNADGRRLLLVSGNNASNGWGTAGANGAQLELIADAQTLNGDIVVDTISVLTMKMTNGTNFTGTINIIDNAEGGAGTENNAVITLDEGCTWKLTGNCTVTSLDNKGTIDFNGFTITLADGTVLQ